MNQEESEPRTRSCLPKDQSRTASSLLGVLMDTPARWATSFMSDASRWAPERPAKQDKGIPRLDFPLQSWGRLSGEDGESILNDELRILHMLG